MKVRNLPDYVKSGSCSDCLKVWDQRQEELLSQIGVLERTLADLTEKPIKKCACGELLVKGTYEGDRAILNVTSGQIVAPVTVTCLMGHVQEIWVDPHEVPSWIMSVGVAT